MMLRELFEVAATNAAGAALLAILALWVESRRVRPELSHALWLLVLARLVMPPGLELALPLLPAAQPTVIAEAIPVGQAFSVAGPAETGGRLGATGWIALAWLLGTVGILTLAAMRIAGFGRSLAGAKPADPGLEARVHGLAARMGMSRAPRVAVIDAPCRPCFGRPPCVAPWFCRQTCLRIFPRPSSIR